MIGNAKRRQSCNCQATKPKYHYFAYKKGKATLKWNKPDRSGT